MAVLLHDAVHRGTGGTLDPRTCRYVNLHHGYLVSIRRFGLCFTHNPSVAEICQWLEDIVIEPVDGKSDIYLGIWRHPLTGEVWCDANLLINTRSEAIRRGIGERQHSIFDNAGRQSLVVPLPARLQIVII